MMSLPLTFEESRIALVEDATEELFAVDGGGRLSQFLHPVREPSKVNPATAQVSRWSEPPGAERCPAAIAAQLGVLQLLTFETRRTVANDCNVFDSQATQRLPVRTICSSRSCQSSVPSFSKRQESASRAPADVLEQIWCRTFCGGTQNALLDIIYGCSGSARFIELGAGALLLFVGSSRRSTAGVCLAKHRHSPEKPIRRACE